MSKIIRRQFSSSVALIYDHLAIRYGGAEVVLECLHDLFPLAPIFTTVAEKSQFNWIDHAQIKTTFLQRVPGLKHHYRLTAPLSPLAIESLELDQFDIIISVTAGAAKGVITKPHQFHLCYQLTPPRYLYDPPEGYLDTLPGFKSILTSWMMKPVLRYLRWWDRAAAHRPDATIAISKLVAERISKFYNLNVDAVIYPPYIPLRHPITRQNTIHPTQGMQANRKTLLSQLQALGKYLLVVSRLVKYKKIDLVIKAAQIAHLPLIIIGTGSEKQDLIKQAGRAAYVRRAGEKLSVCLSSALSNQQSIIFLGQVSHQEKQQLIQNAWALIMAGIEDFGIIGLEAAAEGTRVICHQQSGISEVLKHRKQAWHQTASTARELATVIKQFDKHQFNPQDSIKLARLYTKTQFLHDFANTTYKLFQKHSTI